MVVRWENLRREEDGSLADGFEDSPAWVIEILSPDQSSSLAIDAHFNEGREDHGQNVAETFDVGHEGS